MLIGSRRTRRRRAAFSCASIRRSAVASSGGVILPQCSSRFLRSRLSDARCSTRRASCRGSCLRATATRGGRCGSSPPAAPGRPLRIHRSRGSRSSGDRGPAGECQESMAARRRQHARCGVDRDGSGAGAPQGPRRATRALRDSMRRRSRCRSCLYATWRPATGRHVACGMDRARTAGVLVRRLVRQSPQTSFGFNSSGWNASAACGGGGT